MKKTKIFIASIVIGVACAGIFMSQNQDANVIYLLESVEALANGDINYQEEDKTNDSKTCTLKKVISGTGKWEHGVWIDYQYEYVGGIVNTCKKKDGSTCDPYNCHQRI